MSCFFALLLIAVCILSVFALGIIVGVADCKRRFGIPKGVATIEEWLDMPSSYVDEDVFYGRNET